MVAFTSAAGLRDAYLHDWEALAQTDPLFAVLTDPRFRRESLTLATEREFWASGEEYVSGLHDLFRDHFGCSFAPRASVDFGCGVGRLLVPLARVSGAALGVDAAPTMLALARAECDRLGLANVSLERTLPPGRTFDFVNSTLVFQHVPVRVGLPILDELIHSLAPGGLLALHLLTGRPRQSPGHRLGRWLVANSRPLRSVVNRWQGRPPAEPYMQMNPYPLGRVIEMLLPPGISHVPLASKTADGFESVLLLARKER